MTSTEMNPKDSSALNSSTSAEYRCPCISSDSQPISLENNFTSTSAAIHDLSDPPSYNFLSPLIEQSPRFRPPMDGQGEQAGQVSFFERDSFQGLIF